MNGFSLRAVGTLARNPEALNQGEISYASFCLVGTDFEEGDEQGRGMYVATSIWFIAFGEIADGILTNARKGDQLILEARPITSCKAISGSGKQTRVDYIVTGVRYGAKKGDGFSGAGAVARRPAVVPPDAEVAEAAA